MKKLFSCLVATGLISSMLSVGVMADEPTPEICLNGEYLTCDVEPFYLNDRTMVPLRMISEGMHYDVSWDDATQTVNVESGLNTLSLTIDEYGYVLNGDYYETDAPAVIKNDRTFVPVRFIADAFGCDVNWIAEIYTVEISNYVEVEVTNPEELLNALQSYTRVVLTQPEYNLNEVNGFNNDFITTEYVNDGIEYVVNNISHLTITTTPDLEYSSLICVQPRYANVLSFQNCDNINFTCVTLGHTTDEGYCTGGVLSFNQSSEIRIDGCDLYGCGTYGIIASDSASIITTNTNIHDCTYGAIDYKNVNYVAFEFCSFNNNEGFSLFNLYNCEEVYIVNSEISNNISEAQFLFETTGSKDITIRSCQFEGNAGYESIYNPGADVKFYDCKGDITLG